MDDACGDDAALVQSLLTRGYIRVKCGENLIDLEPGLALPPHHLTGLYVVLDRLALRADNRPRLMEAVESALHEGNGTCRVEVIGHAPHNYSTRFMCQRCERTF